MVVSCAQLSSEDNSRKGLRQSYFKVGHAAACRMSLSSDVLHLKKRGRTAVGDRIVGVRICRELRRNTTKVMRAFVCYGRGGALLCRFNMTTMNNGNLDKASVV